MRSGSPAAAGLLFLVLSLAGVGALAQGDARRGEYLAKAGGCLGCHTEEKTGAVPFAGGRALKTPFGTFYGPNLTPHPEAGLGRWSEADFARALREGRRPDGANYFPAFPYPSFTKISDADVRDLWAYFRTLPANATPSKPHDLGFFYRWRFLVTIWKWLFFSPGAFVADAARSPQVNRGAYLVQALGHCGECHTPRNFLGGTKASRLLAGAKLPEGGGSASNLTPTRLKNVSDADLKSILRSGMTADGDVLATSMAEVVENTTSKLTDPDMDALVAYLRTLPPLPDAPK
jgi:mono/diheme cytochrome c family protein